MFGQWKIKPGVVKFMGSILDACIFCPEEISNKSDPNCGLIRVI